jgi:hypothetical protein
MLILEVIGRYKIILQLKLENPEGLFKYALHFNYIKIF